MSPDIKVRRSSLPPGPALGGEYSITAKPLPAQIIVATDRTIYENEFVLAPVGLDVDMRFKPPEELTYTPGGLGWFNQIPDVLYGVTGTFVDQTDGQAVLDCVGYVEIDPDGIARVAEAKHGEGTAQLTIVSSDRFQAEWSACKDGKTRDTATFEQPKTPAAGIALVMVNGRAVWNDGAATGERPGRALRLNTLGPMGGGMAAH